MLLSYAAIHALNAALTAFDGEASPITNKAGEVLGVERKPAPIAVKVALSIAKLQAAIKPHADRITETRQKLVNVATGGKGKLDAEDPKFGSVQESIAEFLRTEVEVGDLPALLFSDISECKLAPSVLSALLPVLKE